MIMKPLSHHTQLLRPR